VAAAADTVQQVWRKKVSEASRIPECRIGYQKAVRLNRCIPAGVSFAPHRVWTCGQYLCCPFCFYRKVEQLADILHGQARPDSDLVVAVVPVYPRESFFPTQGTLYTSRNVVYRLRTSEKFYGGVALRYLCRNRGKWCVAVVFMGLVLKAIPLTNKKGLEWKRYPATVGGIKLVLTNHVRYPSPVLVEDVDPVVWAGLTSYLRHMRSGKIINKEKANSVHHLQRSALAPKDLGLPSNPLGQLLQLPPGDGFRHGSRVQFGTGG